jgi:hypothetical protein
MSGKQTSRQTGLLILLGLVFVISACGSAEPQIVEVTRIVSQTTVATRIVPQTVEVTQIVPQTVEVTQIVPQTVVVTEIIQIVVTATREPATPTPEATPMPVYQKWRSQQLDFCSTLTTRYSR